MNNYRHISILPTLSKIFEKLGYSQLLSYLHPFKLLIANRFGFRKNVSTYNAIIDTLQYIYDNLDSVHPVISVFLDFAKAFDSVDHEIFHQKMSLYGVRGGASDWFPSYLAQSEQCAFLNDLSSGRHEVEYVVSQGPILDKLLFLIFINEFPTC